MSNFAKNSWGRGASNYVVFTCVDPMSAIGYGPVYAHACIEIHHAQVPVKDMRAGHEMTLENVQRLCANCHRITYREKAKQVGHF